MAKRYIEVVTCDCCKDEIGKDEQLFKITLEEIKEDDIPRAYDLCLSCKLRFVSFINGGTMFIKQAEQQEITETEEVKEPVETVVEETTRTLDDEDLKRGFPQKLKTYRKKNGLSQLELADLIGIGYATLCRLEGGKLSYLHYNTKVKVEKFYNDYM